jgi:membrane-associated phospholipid phosphatase
MYYMFIYGAHKFFVAYMKLVLADPRPYMISIKIKPLHCSNSFGSPSGHSTAATFCLAIFLDVFHGKGTQVYLKPIFYYLAMAATFFWYFSIPYSRFLMGVHSLD